MKKSSKNILLAAVLLSAPLTVYGVLNDPILQVTNYGYVGGASIFSGSAGYNLSVGSNNLFGNSFYNSMVGTNLQNYTSNSLAVGYYNQSTTGQLLSIGNGLNSTSRKNAFEVWTGGNVNIPITTTGAKLTVGNSSVSSNTVTTKVYGTADITRVPAKGGISMGIYLP